MFELRWWIGVVNLVIALPVLAVERDYPVAAVPATAVQVDDAFWGPRLEKNRTVTIPHSLYELERQGSLGGFALLANRTTEKYHGYMWGDSDVYKTLEGIIYSLRTHSDAALQERLEQILGTIVGAQATDGYLMPHVQLAEPNYRHFSEEIKRTCESYDMGHLIESAVAHAEATGRKQYLGAAVKCADLLVRVHAEGKELPISGHPEIELALVRLFRVTGDGKYLELARSLVDGARRHGSNWSGGKPFLADDRAWGHVVAATYLYCGAVDVAALTGDTALLDLIGRKWTNVVGAKLYLTGAAGLPGREAFGQDYELPNAKAYCETCAAIANMLWNWRLFRAHADAKYLDVLERSLYNGFLSGLGQSGDRFFYPNPLACPAGSRYQRVAWFGCPCCPTNIVRFLPQLPGCVFAVRGSDLFVNLFVGGQGRVRLGEQTVTLRQKTRYPWQGTVKITVEPERPTAFSVLVRIPGWASGHPVPGDLYRNLTEMQEPVLLKVNGKSIRLAVEKGFARIDRTWQRGDTVQLDLPMPIRRVVAHPSVSEDVGCVALERGPVVHCLEGVDHDGHVHNLVLSDDARLVAEPRPEMLGGLIALSGTALALKEDSAGKVTAEPRTITAIPYYAWNHRGPGEMAVWVARTVDKAIPWRPSASVNDTEGKK